MSRRPLQYPRVQFVRRLHRQLYTYTAITKRSEDTPWRRDVTFRMPNLHPFWTRPELLDAWTAARGVQ